MQDSIEPPDYFLSTKWTVILRARGEGEPATEALNELCTAYRRPVLQFILSRTGSREQAEDLTQDYFADLLRRGYLASAERDAGKFRAFLCADVKLFLHNAWRKARAQKRGGGRAWELLDENAEAAVEGETFDAVFDRNWALEVLERARERLEAEYAAGGKEGVFAALSPLMDKNGESGMYAAAAETLRMTEGSLKVALHRLRERLGRHLLSVVADTVSGPEEAREELRYLFRALSQCP